MFIAISHHRSDYHQQSSSLVIITDYRCLRRSSSFAVTVRRLRRYLSTTIIVHLHCLPSVIVELLLNRSVNWVGTPFNYFRLSPRCTV